MDHVHLIELARRQHNRFSRAQAFDLGHNDKSISRRIESGQWEVVEEGVYAIAPVLDDDWGRWMGATLTAPGTYLAHVSAAAAFDSWGLPREFEVVVRRGDGGPRRFGGVLVHHSETLAESETCVLRAVSITTPERTLIDLARHLAPKPLARVLRDLIRGGHTTPDRVVDAILSHRGERGTRKLANVLASYAGLPIHRARSGAEVRALVLLKEARYEMPELNHKIAGEEADLTWGAHRLIIEIDGGPFHLDVGEDARKQAIWEKAGWTVLRIPADDVYEHPERLLALAPGR